LKKESNFENIGIGGKQQDHPIFGLTKIKANKNPIQEKSVNWL